MGLDLTTVCPADPGPHSLTLEWEMFSSSWSKDAIQGLLFGCHNIWMPQIHHENHSWALLYCIFMDCSVPERIIEGEAASFCPTLGLSSHHQLTDTWEFSGLNGHQIQKSVGPFSSVITVPGLCLSVSF